MFKQMNAVTILLAATLTITPAATAQTGTHYTRRAADTLRYREVSTGHMRVRTPEGQDVPLETEHEALIAVTFGPADTLRAWYDSLAIGLVGPGGATRPATQTVLHQPFLLRFDPRGHTETLATPAFPASFNGVTDLTRQFDDFFLRLPEGDLKPGIEWTDSVRIARGGTDDHSVSRAWVSYRVERDTTVGEARALIITAHQRIRMDSDGPIPNQPLRSSTALEGEDDGFFVFDPASGVLLGRRRSGHVAGTVTITGGPQPMVLDQSYTYTNRVDRVR